MNKLISASHSRPDSEVRLNLMSHGKEYRSVFVLDAEHMTATSPFLSFGGV